MITYKEYFSKLTKMELGSELGLEDKDIRRKRKEELVRLLLDKVNDELFVHRLFRKYSSSFALHPSKVEEMFTITTTERKRWTEEGKLIVHHYDRLEKWGRSLEIPMYDVIEISKITNELIEVWRDHHKQVVQKKRKRSTSAAKRTKNRNERLQLDFLDQHWNPLLVSWYSASGQLGSTLELSFWTMWINLLAKDFQLKAIHARTKKDEYENKKIQFYELKNKALTLLVLSPYAKLSFYTPSQPHKIEHLFFCPNHYKEWVDLRSISYVSKWDFFYMFHEDIRSCGDCSFKKIHDYFSLYYLAIQHESLEDCSFSFHIPYPIGKTYLPGKHRLEKVEHEEQEGFFRFGRNLLDEEKVFFKENFVLHHFEEAITKFQLYFS